MKRAKNNFLFFVLILIPAFISCSDNKIDQDTAVKIYVERIMVEEKYSYSLDSIKVHMDKVFKRYDVASNEFESYIKDMSDDQEKWTEFFKKAKNYLAELKKGGAIQ